MSFHTNRILVESTGPHVGDTQKLTREALRLALEQTPSLHHLSHYTGADWDFSVDAAPAEAAVPTRQLVQRYRAVGCNLIAKLTLLADQLTEPGTGALIRTVLHAGDGVIYSNTVMQGERVLGVTCGRYSPPSPRHHAVDAADRAVSGLVTQLRSTFGQPTQDPGGFEHFAEDQAQAAGAGPDRAGDAATPMSLCEAALSVDDLQFVAYVKHGVVEFADDVFDQVAMEPFFRAGYTVAFRRRFYLDFATEMEFHVRDLGRIVHPMVGRGLGRVVLDVQRGALYYYRLDTGSYLVGVTLNQFKVASADVKMDQLCRRLTPR